MAEYCNEAAEAQSSNIGQFHDMMSTCMETVVCHFEEYQKQLQNLIETVLRSVDELDDTTKRHKDVRELIQLLRGACADGNRFVSLVREFIECGQDQERVNKAKVDVQNQRFSQTQCLVEELEEYVEDALDYFEKFSRQCDIIDGSAKEKCKDCADQRKKYKIKAIAAAGSTVALGAGVGVAGVGMGATAIAGTIVSVSSAPFTFGIGTLVGLGATGAVVGTVGATVLGAGAVVAFQTKKVLRTFKDIEKVLNDVAGEASMLRCELTAIQDTFSILTKKLSGTRRWLDQQDIDTICTTLDRLLKGCSKADMADIDAADKRLKELCKELDTKASRMPVF